MDEYYGWDFLYNDSGYNYYVHNDNYDAKLQVEDEHRGRQDTRFKLFLLDKGLMWGMYYGEDVFKDTSLIITKVWSK